MSEAENTIFTFEGAAGTKFDDFDYTTVAPNGEYRAVLLKIGPHVKENKVTLRCSFGVHSVREGQGPRVDTYVPVTPGKQRSQLFRALGFASLDQQADRFTFDVQAFKDCECWVTLGQEQFRGQAKNNIKNLRPINNDGSPTKRIAAPTEPAPEEAAAPMGFSDDAGTPFG